MAVHVSRYGKSVSNLYDEDQDRNSVEARASTTWSAMVYHGLPVVRAMAMIL